MVSYELKQLVNSMCDTIEMIASKGGLDAGTDQAAKVELGMFMMYLSASDGEISWEEARIISDICDLNISPSQLGDFIREKGIYTTEFEQKVPVTFQLMVEADKALIENGINISASEAMLGTYKAVGEALIKSDGDIDDNEVADYRIYTNMLEEYRDRNLGSGSKATGFTKGGSSVSAPTKGGVQAPRKG